MRCKLRPQTQIADPVGILNLALGPYALAFGFRRLASGPQTLALICDLHLLADFGPSDLRP